MKVIVAYDGSPAAKRAVESLAWIGGQRPTVFLVTVIRGMALDSEGEPRIPDVDELAEAQAMLANIAVRVDEILGSPLRSEVLVGDAKDRLVEFALAEKADLVITGSRGLGLGKRLVFGSVSSNVLHEVDCAVMVVK